MSQLALRQDARRDSADDSVVAIPKDFRLQSGDMLSDAQVRVRRYGPQGAPLVAALGGISAGREVSGENGWWSNVVAPGGGVDTRRYGVLGFDFAPLADERVRITPHDQARLLAIALEGTGVDTLHAIIGASYGGMIGLAFAELFPHLLGRLCVISASHKPSAQALAWRGVQRRMVEFGLAHGDAAGGLELARQLAMITYRTGEEFQARFGAGVDDAGRGEVDRYLISRGQAYRKAIAPLRWLSLSESIDRFEFDPNAATTPTTLVACPNDHLAPFADTQELGRLLPNLRAMFELNSICGHDAFLTEPEQLGPILARFLEDDGHG